jgi:hypothetical protein
MTNLDPRIGKLNSGLFYAFVNGYDRPEFVGTLKEVEIELGVRLKVTNRRLYIVTMTQGRDVTHTEHMAYSAAQAISKAREFWNQQDGRTRSCNLLPRSFRARVV